MKKTPATTTVDYFLTYEPGKGYAGKLDEKAAARRHADHEPYVLASGDRVVRFGPGHDSVEIRSIGQQGVRGHLYYQRHRDTGRYRLSRMRIHSRGDETLTVEVAPWGGTGQLKDSRENRVQERTPPDEWLREVDVAVFGEWEDLLAMPMDPHRWLAVPDGFAVRP